jgi:hypothetical protein
MTTVAVVLLTVAIYVLFPKIVGLEDVWGTIKSGDPVSLIKEELAEEKTDLVVLGRCAGSDKPYGIGETDAVLRSSLCDILVIPVHGCS